MSFDALLAPISDQQPCGADLSLSSEFDAIRELRREDDPTLDLGDWVTALKSADWIGVRQHCERLMTGRTKDLRLLAWWMEARAQLDGLQGLAAGLALTLALLRQHWPDLHPRIEAGDSDERVGALSWLLGRVVVLAETAPVLTLGRRRLGLLQLEQLRLGKPLAQTGSEADDAAPSWAQAQRRLMDEGQTPQRERQQALQQARRDLAALALELDARLGADAPAFAAAERALALAEDRLQRGMRDAGLLAPVDAAAPATPAQAAQPGAPAPGAPQGREQALQQLRAVAAAFRHSEPHSPVAYLADKAVRWAEMPLHAWLRQVVKDAGTLDRLDDLLGVEAPPPPA